MPSKKIAEKVTNISQLQVEDGILYDADANPVPVALGRGVKPSAYTANPSATANTYGTEATIFDGYAFIPQSIVVVFGGTISSETITTTITATYSDNTTETLDITATATGTKRALYGDANQNLEALVKNGVYIKKLTAKSKSTKANSTGTVTVQPIGYGA